jgi:hypothetical protein
MAENAQRISIAKKDEYLSVTLPSYESLGKRKVQLSVIYDAVGEHGCRRLLIDSRATRKQVPIMDLFGLATYLARKFKPLPVKMAVLVSPEAVYPDRFGETVARNRGLDLIRFVDNEQEALNWLLARNPAIDGPAA